MIDEENYCEPESKASYDKYPVDPGLVVFLVAVLGSVPRASCTQDKHSASEL